MSAHKTYPIILAHGITRPDYLVNLLITKLKLNRFESGRVFDELHYFKGIASHLEKHGFEVRNTNVSFAAGLETRAKDLRNEIQRILARTGYKKVHIIGHSMGGLDARYMIVNLGMADKVASVTSIGTPHLGTSLADWGLQQGGDKLIESFRAAINLEGFNDLTTTAAKEFNEQARLSEATNEVVYQAYASTQEHDLTFFPLQKSWEIVYEREGENDGLVPFTSQQWQSQLISDDGRIKTIKQKEVPFPADHVNQMGWWHINREKKIKWWDLKILRRKSKFEKRAKDLYLRIAREAAEF